METESDAMKKLREEEIKEKERKESLLKKQIEDRDILGACKK